MSSFGRYIKAILIVSLLAVFGINPALAQETFIVSDDTYINGANANSNYAGASDIIVHSYGPKIGLAQFDLSSIGGANVSNAQLQFRLNSLKSSGSFDLQLLTQDWTGGSVTFASQPSSGPSLVNVPLSSANVGTIVSVDVTAIVQDWVSGAQPNFGLRFEANSGIKAQIDSLQSGGTPMALLVTHSGGQPTVETPVISPDGGNFVESVEVSLTTSPPGAEIYYTLDGSTPSSGSISYSVTGPFTLTDTTTVKAIGIEEGYADSPVATAVFTKNDPGGGGSTQNLDAIEDTYANGGSANSNFSGNSDVVVHNYGPKLGFVRFDTSSVAGLPVTSAAFEFHLNNIKSSGEIDIHVVTESWTENGLSFNNQPAYGPVVMTVPVNSSQADYSVDLTGIVQDWASGSQLNFGLALTTGNSIKAEIDSSESGGTPMRLVVTVDDGPPTVATPTISPNGGNFTGSVEVSLSTSPSSAQIYYTLNGSEPTSGSTPYSGPFTLTDTTTVKARGILADYNDSQVASATFTDAPPPNNPPQIAPVGNKSVTVGQLLEFTVSATDADATTPLLSASNLPGNASPASFNASGGVGTFSWTPQAGDVDTYTTVTFTATDQDDPGITTDEVIEITVSNPSGGGSTQNLDAVEDSYVNGRSAGANYGGNSDIVIHNFGPKTGLVRFDTSSISGVPVTGATFEFQLNGIKSAGDLDIHIVTQDWNESNVSFSNQPNFGPPVLTVPLSTSQAAYSIDVTSIVQDWADGSQANFGFALTSGDSIKAEIDSSESSGTPMRLIVTVDDGTPTVATPTISPNGGSFGAPVQVTVETSTPDASIYYTLDGSAPTTASNVYGSPFTIPASATVRTRAFAAGLNDSIVSQAEFTITGAGAGGDINNYWPLNETGSGAYANVAGGAAGSCATCPVPAGGRVGGGQVFNGFNDGIDIADDDSADWTQSGGFSAELWWNKSTSCSGREVGVGRSDAVTPVQWALGCANGLPYFELIDSNGTSATATGATSVTDGDWHHLAGVYDGFFNEIRLYVDGVLAATAPASYSGNFDSTAPLTIGYLADVIGVNYFEGTLDEVALHDRALPVSVISRHQLDGAIGLREGYIGCTATTDVMPLGDSNTASSGYRTTLWFELTGQGYDVNFVGSRADGSWTGSHDRDHEGWSGYTTTDIAANLNSWLALNPPRVVLLHIGTNDMDDVPVLDAIAGLESILDIINDFDPSITVVLGQIINRKIFHQPTADFNDAMAAVAASRIVAGEKILLVNHEPALTYPDDMSDTKHPNGFGYAKMAGVWFDDGLTEFMPACNFAAPRFKSNPPGSAATGVPYVYRASVIGSPTGRFTLLTAPAGMSVNADTGEVRWTPGSTGVVNIDLQVENTAGYSVQSFKINVN